MEQDAPHHRATTTACGDLLETAGEDGIILTIDEIAEVGERLLLSTVDWQRLQSVWGLRSGAIWP